MEKIISIGEICVDWVLKVKRFPEIDEKIYYQQSGTFPGGVIANYSVGVARLGGNVSFIGGIGKDSWGDFLKKNLLRENVDTSLMVEYENQSTAVNIIAVNENGDKLLFMDPNLKNNVPPPEYFEKQKIVDAIRNTKLVHMSAIRLESALIAAKIAKSHGRITSLDLEKHAIDEYGREMILELLKHIDILLPNKLAARTLTGKNNFIEAAKSLSNYGPKTVIITLGEKGSLLAQEKEIIEIPAYKINPIDTTGAGDAFNAAFTLFHVIEGYDPKDASIIANAAAALKCTKLGAQTGMPNRKELETFLRERGHTYKLTD